MKVQPKQVVLALGALFIGLIVWNNPSDTGESTGDFIGDTVSWFQDAFDKLGDFSQSAVD